MTDSGNAGPLGCSTHAPSIDAGTLCRVASHRPGLAGARLVLDPIEISPLESDEVTAADRFDRKLEVGEAVYWELGLAGQIVEKFLSLPYRQGGTITFRSGKLKGKGLVCTSFAKVFGALWFTGDPTKQERLGSRSPAPVYAEKYGGFRVNDRRRRLRKLVGMLDTSRLYCVVTYNTRIGDTRRHVWFLIFSKLLGAWVRIESTGWKLKRGGEGPGPGLYRLRYGTSAASGFHQAWDWGEAERPRNPDIDHWDFT